jgi:hypothetical protein
VVYLAGCAELMRLMPRGCMDVIFRSTYGLSDGGATVEIGRLAPVDKRERDRWMGLREGARVGMAKLIRPQAERDQEEDYCTAVFADR